MKYYVLFAVALSVFSVNVFGQHCKKVKEKTDPFTNETEKTAQVTIGKINMIKGGTKWLIDISQSAGITTTKWNIAMIGEFNQVFPADTKLLLKLADGNVVTLATETGANPVTQAVASTSRLDVFTSYSLVFKPSKSELSLLSNSPIAHLRVDVPDQKIVSPEIVEKQMEELRNVFNCMLTTQK